MLWPWLSSPFEVKEYAPYFSSNIWSPFEVWKHTGISVPSPVHPKRSGTVQRNWPHRQSPLKSSSSLQLSCLDNIQGQPNRPPWPFALPAPLCLAITHLLSSLLPKNTHCPITDFLWLNLQREVIYKVCIFASLFSASFNQNSHFDSHFFLCFYHSSFYACPSFLVPI